MMAPMEKVYLGPNPCFLCKQDDPSSYILTFRMSPDNEDSRPDYRPLEEHSIWMHQMCNRVFQCSIWGLNMPFSHYDTLCFAKASKLLYPKPQELEGRRTRFSNLEGLARLSLTKISSCYQEAFRHDLFARFPAEIKLMIVDLIGPCWYLTIVGETRRLFKLWLKNRHQKQCALLELSEYIWVYTILYRGVRYVARLSEKQLELPSIFEECRMELPNKLKQIVLSMDCVGICQIQLVSQDSKPVSDGSPWYKILDVSGPKLDIRVDCEGLFVRDIELASNRLETRRFNIWSSPFPPKHRIPWRSCRIPKNQYRMHYEKLDSNTKGLVACCANDTTIGIHAFSELSKPYHEFVDLMHRRAGTNQTYWMYFPLNGNEHIEHIWVRNRNDKPLGETTHPVLMLQTSLGRQITWGPQISTGFPWSWTPLASDDNEIVTGILHDSLDPDSYQINAFGVTKDNSYSQQKLLGEPWPTMEPPEFDFELPSIPCWYLTTASLHGLIRMQICRDQGLPHRPCIGLLLFYDDQHIESLGEVRWELDMTQEIIAPAYIETNNIDGNVYIKDVQSDEPHGSELDTITSLSSSDCRNLALSNYGSTKPMKLDIRLSSKIRAKCHHSDLWHSQNLGTGGMDYKEAKKRLYCYYLAYGLCNFQYSNGVFSSFTP